MRKIVDIKKATKKILKYVLTFIAMIAIFSLSMIITYSLPNDKIRNNIEESLEVLIQKDNNPLFEDYVQGAELDQYTDILILSTAINKGMYEKQSVLQKAFENSHYVEENNQMESMKEILANPNLYNKDEYSRYWHGIQVIIRPLLIIFNYEEIRYIFYIIMAMLLTYSSYLTYRNVSIYHAFAYILSLTIICIYIVPSSIQYFGIFVVSILGIIAINLLYIKGKENLYPYCFIVIGCCAAFFDLLTTPIISIGLPLLSMVMIEMKKGEKTSKIFKKILIYTILWAISYGATFVTKWLLASIVLQRDAVTSAINQLFFRFNGYEDHKTNRIRAIIHNIKFIAYNKAFLTIYTFVFIVWFIAFIKKGKKTKDSIKYILLYLFIASYPYVWYFVIAGHSMTHGWFTNRAQVVSILASFSVFIESINITKIKEISAGRIR